MNRVSRRHRWIKERIPVLLTAYLILVFAAALLSFNVLIRDLKADLGNKAMVLAVDISHWLQLDRGTAEVLLAQDFNSLLENPVNREFEQRARNIMAHSEIKYIYLRAELPPEQVKYQVEAAEADVYKLPAGTPLSHVYVLDAVVDEATRLADTEGQGYTDKDRYTAAEPTFTKILKERKAAYALDTAEWGTYLSGYAPFYTTDGEFLGMIGVDLYPENYYTYVRKSLMLFAAFATALILGGLLVSRLWTRAWRAEERIRLEDELATRDTLTGLMNRRSFMELLAHEYAACRREGMSLTLMLCEPELPEAVRGAERETGMKNAAAWLRQMVKRSADGLCRYSDESFAVFLSNTEGENGLYLARQILEDPQSPWTIGVLALQPEEPLEEKTLADQLEGALGAAKKQGRRRAVLLDETH